jgi:hypothetical protein
MESAMGGTRRGKKDVWFCSKVAQATWCDLSVGGTWISEIQVVNRTELFVGPYGTTANIDAKLEVEGIKPRKLFFKYYEYLTKKITKPALFR